MSGDDRAARDESQVPEVELSVGDLDSSSLAPEEAERVRGGAASPAGPVPIPYPNTGSPASQK
jgi:hypothetical protein